MGGLDRLVGCGTPLPLHQGTVIMLQTFRAYSQGKENLPSA